MNIEQLNKLGPKNKALLNKLNINTLEDLVTYFPYRYNFINITNTLTETTEVIYVNAIILSDVKVNYIRKNFNALSFIASLNNFNFKVTIYNRAFLKNSLTINKEVLLIGKYKKNTNTFIANDLKFNVFNNKIEAIYHLTEGLKLTNLTKYIEEALNKNILIEDYIPDSLNQKYNFISKTLALKYIHFPINVEQIKQAKLKLIYEELFVYMFKINYISNINKKVQGLKKEFSLDIIDEFIASLPFKLTEDQLTTIKDILNDLKSPKRMNRLVLGDVGSGKTIVAVVALFANYLSGYQASFMAPTEILAKQHYESLINYFKETNINISLLTGSMKKKEKEEVYQKIQAKKIDIVIGTHALLNEQITYAKLGLVITDEQHRFGVNQRNTLQNKDKAKVVDVLALSATPIPRTYALTIYGDMDISQIKTKPKMRQETKTYIKSEEEIKDVLEAMYQELKQNHQIFIVSPLIENEEENDLKSVTLLKEKMDLAFKKKVRIEIIHGKLKQSAKDALMEEFKLGNIKILISTTVIEVGIDIPNATMMVIYNAEKFGLATLHQLRGRVGRNDLPSYCYLISKEKDNARLKVMEESTDGFYISEKDFELRGQGDLFGVKQSGDMTFKIANLKNDYKILLRASLDAKEYINSLEYQQNKLYKELIEEINFLD